MDRSLIRLLTPVVGITSLVMVGTMGVSAQDAERRDTLAGDQSRHAGSHELRTARATKIQAMNVVNRQDETLGDIENLLIDRDATRVTHVVVGKGGILGFGEDQVAIPFEVLDFNEENAVLDMDAEAFKNAPKLEKDTWKKQYDEPGFRERVRRFYGMDDDAATARRRSTTETDRSVNGPRGSGTTDGQFSPVAASDVLGKNVKNEEGKSLGEIDDLMIETDNGHIVYAALQFGGFAGVGDKLFAVPFQHLRPLDKDRPFVIDVDKERLENAPGFDQDAWPTENRPEWIAGVYTFYGEAPTWQDRRGAQSADDPTLSKESSALPLELKGGQEQTYRVYTSRSRAAVTSTESSAGGYAASVNDTNELGIRVEDVASDGDATLRIRMTKASPASSAVEPDTNANDRDKQSSDALSEATHEFIAKVDKTGAVKEFRRSTEPDRGRIGRATARTDEENVESTAGKTAEERRRAVEEARSAKSTDEATAAADSPMADHHAKALVECVLGAGLHGKELQPGQLYSAEEMLGFDKKSKDEISKESDALSKDQGSKDARQDASASKDGGSCIHASNMCSTLCAARFRYEGSRSDECHFSIVRADSSAPSLERGESSDRERSDRAAEDRKRSVSRDDRRDSANDGTALPPSEPRTRSDHRDSAVARAHGRLGTAVYSKEDGLLERLQVTMRVSAEADQSSSRTRRSTEGNQRDTQEDSSTSSRTGTDRSDREDDSGRDIGRDGQDRQGREDGGGRNGDGVRRSEQFVINIYRL